MIGCVPTHIPVQAPQTPDSGPLPSSSTSPGPHTEEQAPPPVFPSWARSVAQVCEHYGVDPSVGLLEADIEKKRQQYGWNELEKLPGTSFLQLVLEQFDDALVQILVAAAGVSFLLALSDAQESGQQTLESFTEPLVILAIVVLNAVVGVWQESRAESTLEVRWWTG